MIKIIVEKNGNGKKLVTYIQNKFNKISSGTIYKALRNKDIRINDVKTTENITLSQNDEITLYIKDELLYGTLSTQSFDTKLIVYEDKNIIIVNKPKNLLVQSSTESCLEKMVSDYCKSVVKPCHRIDRNTTGLVVFAKNAEAESILLDMFKGHFVSKYYKCTIHGHFSQKAGTLYAYLFKDSKNSNVIISDVKKKGYVQIITKYTVLKCNSDNTSLLEVELVTGKTHQIRAHLAHVGHPIIGDGKYGINEINKKFGKKTQELESYKIHFNNAYGILEYLKNKTFEI